ncbi:PLP-dependent aminotransferase family protein [Amycolatopsis carbonis]|uniref:PLP-dependent aminotransferase family protein n=1 Tax=Amycolatopsis carbonis TaxID=715471 RepID=A0A9Y2IAS2_9PSEU|nr:PLP-dependent aminotransferase family protein [Amycolatopsis sp. 2-15]WIX74953.1 PLP-dependent aminotransferase family protein [Amycolatopsis sp. 2-15]
MPAIVAPPRARPLGQFAGSGPNWLVKEVYVHRVTPAELVRLLGAWRGGGPTLPAALAATLAELVDSAVLPEAAVLPAQRPLARALGVSRGTVTSAYDQLTAGGRLTAEAGSGSRVRRRQPGGPGVPGGRLVSFTGAAAPADLSSGALPGSALTADGLAALGPADLEPYLGTDGYFPAGIPRLRATIARLLTDDGVPTTPEQVLVTAGAQQAVWLVANTLVTAGDLVVVEEPSYRGALEAFAGAGTRLRGIRWTGDGIDRDQLQAALRRSPALLYCQPSVHNPTGERMPAAARRELGKLITAAGLRTVEDRSSADLAFRGPAPGLAAHVPPELLVSIGTASKLFWGGVRIGWIRADAPTVARLTEARKAIDLGCSVVDQLLVAGLLRRVAQAREARRALLAARWESTVDVLGRVFPHWRWTTPAGGTGLWADTGEDAVRLAQRALTAGVKLAPGPAFSVYDGFRTHLRLPLWHAPRDLEPVLASLR